MKLQEAVNLFKKRRIAVIGDLMLDIYLWGRVNRISPEAPVPIVQIDKRTCCLGGAANVMSNIINLGSEVSAYGIVGQDETGLEVIQLLKNANIDAQNVKFENNRRTTEKRRVLSGAQQLLREDYEDLHAVSDLIREEIAEKVCRNIKEDNLSAIIFEDYGKGLLSDNMVQYITNEANKKGIVTALDPKPGNLKPIKGLTVIKPNRNEAFALSGIEATAKELPFNDDEALKKAAKLLHESWDVKYLLISLAAHGMALYSKDFVNLIPTKAREVFDVSGAGDTVTATFTVAMASGFSPIEAAEMANLAAGVVVGKVGTSPITIDELKKVWSE